MEARLVVAAVNVRVRRGVRLVGGRRDGRIYAIARNARGRHMRWLPTLARRARLRRVGRELERAEREGNGSVCTTPSSD